MPTLAQYRRAAAELGSCLDQGREDGGKGCLFVYNRDKADGDSIRLLSHWGKA